MAAGKPQNLLVPLIVSVVVTVAAGVTAFIFYQQWTKAETELASAKDARTKADTAKATADANLKILKEKIGYPDAEFGTAQDAPGSSQSLMSKVAEELTKYNDPKDPPSLSFKDELGRLAQKNDNTAKELANMAAAKKTLELDFQAKQNTTTTQINEHDQKMQDAEKSRLDNQTEVERSLAERDRQILTNREQANQKAQEKQQIQNEYTKYKERNDIDKNKLAQAVTEYKESLQKIQSSGSPVGSVVTVDNLNNEVYIDRGEADLLTLQTTMSIWSADKKGTLHWRDKNEKIKSDAKKEYEESDKKNALEPRLEGGPKAYIEIVAVLGPHQAKGRITMEQTLNPITPGDLLFSPIWAPGQKKHFALAGRFDMTGKDTDDRVLLINLIKRQGGVIDCWVDNEGIIQPPEGNIEVGTHYLVIGKMPGEGETDREGKVEGEGTQKEKENATKIRQSKDKLELTAKSLGVEIIDQYKLYDFMGYKPHSNKYEPGGYIGGPAPKNRFDNPSNSTQPKGVSGYESGASSRPKGIPGSSSGQKK